MSFLLIHFSHPYLISPTMLIAYHSKKSLPPTTGKYKLIKTIGKGNFAKVKLARHLPTDREVSGGGLVGV